MRRALLTVLLIPTIVIGVTSCALPTRPTATRNPYHADCHTTGYAITRAGTYKPERR